MTHDAVLSFGPDHYQLSDQELVDLERWGLVTELDGQPYPPAPADPAPAPEAVITTQSAGDGEEETTP